MHEVSLYVDIEEIKSVEQQEHNLFVKEILEQLGIPYQDIWKDDILEVEQKVALRSLLSKFGIDIIDDGDRGTKIYHENDCIATWHKPKIILRKNEVTINHNKKFYYEIILKTESMFEEK